MKGLDGTRRPVVFRDAVVVTMDDRRTVLDGGDLLVVDDRIAAVGHRLGAPDGALEIDASGGILMPGMIDTHRHLWQTAMRGYGTDWTLTLFIALFERDHGEPLGYQREYARRLADFSPPYPDFAT